LIPRQLRLSSAHGGRDGESDFHSQPVHESA
jgi:hypothetical protein